MAISKKQIKQIIERRHPRYKELLAHWLFLDATYNGGRAWFKDNIFRYLKEGDDEYEARVDRAYRFNHTREVVDLVNKYLFRTEVIRNEQDAPKAVQEFWENVDGSGTGINEFVKVISTKTSIRGRHYIVVDNKMTEVSETTSQADEQPNSIYAYVVSPVDVLDMSWGEDGELNWILLREYVRDDNDPFESTGKVMESFRLWTRDRWYQFKYSGKASNYKVPNVSHIELATTQYEVFDQGEHGLGVVPAIPVDNIVTDDKWASPALINDIAYLDRAVANYLSNLDAIIQDQSFSQLAMPAQNLMPGDDGHQAVLNMGTKRVFTYDGEGGKGPEFLSPDPRQAQLILSAIQQIINEVYHSVGLAGERTKQDNAKGIDNSSGVAKSKDFERVNSLLIAKADTLEGVENKLTKLVALWAGQESKITDDLVEYPDNFDVRGLYDEFDIAMQLALLDAPVVMRAEQMMKVAKRLFPVMDQALEAKIKKQIEQWRDELKERRELDMESLQNQAESTGQLIEEAKRNRDASGDKQSATKSRQANSAKEGQAKDQETN